MLVTYWDLDQFCVYKCQFLMRNMTINNWIFGYTPVSSQQVVIFEPPETPPRPDLRGFAVDLAAVLADSVLDPVAVLAFDF